MGTGDSGTGSDARPRRGAKGAPGTRHQPGEYELESDRNVSRDAAKNQKKCVSTNTYVIFKKSRWSDWHSPLDTAKRQTKSNSREG
jgi:hypothetical protein